MNLGRISADVEFGHPVLFPNRPNPFCSSMVLQLYLPRQRTVALELYDAASRLVRTPQDAMLDPGVAALS